MKYVNGLTIEVTKKCNSRCKYCFSSSSPQTMDEIPLKSLINLIDQYEILENKLAYDYVKNKKLKSQVIITGGEFLLHNNWREFLTYLTKKNIAFEAASNAIALDDDAIDFLNKTSINILQISLDGMREEDNLLRNPQKTKQVINRLKQLANSPLKERIRIKATLTKQNYKSASELIAFSKEIGLELVFGYVQVLGRAASNFSYVLESNDIVDFNKQIVEKYPDLVLPLMFSHAPCPLDIDTEPLAFRIAANGDIFPCASFHEQWFCIGNLYKNSLKEAISGNKFVELQTWVKNRKNLMSKGVCKGCYAVNICQGSCPAASYYECGDAYIPTKRICYAAQKFNYYMLPKLLKNEVRLAERK